MSLIKKALVRVSGNKNVQKLLYKNVETSQYLMGIGSGDEVFSSGEQAIFDVLKHRCKPPYCIFDVGSNKGQFLQLARDSIVSAGFSIHCFEPGHDAYERLVASAAEDKRVRLNNIGLGSDVGEAVLYFDAAGSGLASLTKRKLDHFGIEFGGSESVGIATVDQYCLDNDIERINLLKLDIEGHELDALTGAKNMFDKKAIDLVTFEFGGCNIDTRTFFQDFWYFFKDLDMQIHRITPSGYIHPIYWYRELEEQFRTTNFIVVLKR